MKKLVLVAFVLIGAWFVPTARPIACPRPDDPAPAEETFTEFMVLDPNDTTNVLQNIVISVEEAAKRNDLILVQSCQPYTAKDHDKKVPIYKNVPGPGCRFDPAVGVIPPRAFASWTLDEQKAQYVCPVAKPTDLKLPQWVEPDAQKGETVGKWIDAAVKVEAQK